MIARRTFAGTPATSEPDGTSVPSSTTAPAATSEPAPISEVLLVLDATTGQNGVVQAQAFLEQAGVTGLVITKLDGSAKGGFVLRVQDETGIPIKLIGQGERLGDLTGFSPNLFARGLVGA